MDEYYANLVFSFISSTTPRLSTTTTTHTIHFYPNSIVHPMHLCDRVLLHPLETTSNTARSPPAPPPPPPTTTSTTTTRASWPTTPLPSPSNSRLQSEGITFVSMEIGRHAAMLSRRPGRDCEPTARGMHDSAKPAPTPHTNTSLYRLQTDRQTDTTRLPAMIMSPWARVTRAALRGMEHFPLNGGVMGGEMKRSCPSAVR